MNRLQRLSCLRRQASTDATIHRDDQESALVREPARSVDGDYIHEGQFTKAHQAEGEALNVHHLQSDIPNNMLGTPESEPVHLLEKEPTVLVPRVSPAIVYLCGGCGHEYQRDRVEEQCPECGSSRGVWDSRVWPRYCQTETLRTVYREIKGMVEVTLTYGGGAALAPSSPDARIDIEKFRAVTIEDTPELAQLTTQAETEVDPALEGDPRREAIEKLVNDKILQRIQLLEELSQVTKIKWINAWRHLEERVAKASETEKVRVRAADKAYRAKPQAEGDKEKKPRIAKPKDKRGAAIAVLMSLGYTEVEAIAKVDAAPKKE